jgi:hypothetical protein
MRRSSCRLAAVILAALAALIVPTAAPGPLPTAHARAAVHVMPTRLRAGAIHGSLPITFHGGAVMTGHVNVYVVWYGTWPATSVRRTVIADFVRSLPSPYWAINRTFPSGSGAMVANDISLAGQTDDIYSLGAGQLTDIQIEQIVVQAIRAKALPKDSHGVYLVLTSADVGKVGFLTQYCGWHSSDTVDGSVIKFAFIGDPTGADPRLCGLPGGSPNGDKGADAMVSVIAHELDEAVTDPTLHGWYASDGEENADRCAFQYGATYAVGNQVANMKLGTRDYLIQANWVNGRSPHCGLSA